MTPPDRNPPARSVAETAARWVVRRDRGLSPSEQDAFLQWLAADPRHAAAMARERGTWESFDRLAGLQSAVQAVPDPDLLAPARLPATRRTGRRIAWLAGSLAAAAAAAMLLPRGGRMPDRPPPSAAVALARTVPLAPIEERTLADGSKIRLNRGAAVTVDFSAAERRVRLDRGEAAFAVAKDPARPFVVISAGVAVRALGTSFNVRLEGEAVEVIITEGRVAVAGGSAVAEAAIAELGAGQRALVPVKAGLGSPSVAALTDDELSRRLAWQPRMLSFTDESLPSILTEFNRHNPGTLRVDSQALQMLRLTARFRSDNVEGFLRLLASDFGVRAERAANGDIVLRPAL